MLTTPLPTNGFNVSAIKTDEIGLKFNSPTFPTYSISRSKIGESKICPINEPKILANLIHGFNKRASYGSIEGAFNALAIAPFFR